MVQGLYALWMARNNARDGKRIEEEADTAGMVRRLMEEWQNVNGRASKIPEITPVQKWSAQEEGWIKANVDGAATKGGEKGAVAWCSGTRTGLSSVERAITILWVETQQCWSSGPARGRCN